jgi:lipopolysaccharide export LptBFGC system permease protein LptF
MYQKFWLKPVFQMGLHICIFFLIFINIFYILENYKIQKTNLKLKSYQVTLQQNIASLKSQNTYESLAFYKDKIIKRNNFKKNSEEVLDFSKNDEIAMNNQNKTDKKVEIWQKWVNCLSGETSNNKKILDSSSFCK